ncbi:glycosyltransferase involved in cell wall biosynthesis [Bacteroides reticulotermitis]|uniref:Glycosyltransferase involved in cell wall biosynthesis n=1 Tax=Bacteroides reticulotermitis TaxID=1133319 RepID=A0A840D316_9BACE|nr:glycosyltransferase family 4 protein [Bacteroides reticulotermitis]MBB4044808.1 glycosyltransferase involved in cell wall biosynthesis [Bacteroides reticulotermitis]
MKIVYYLPSLYAPGGLERIVTFKANYFAEHFEGYEVYIITSEQMGKEPHFPLSPKVKHIDLDVVFDWPYDQSRLSKALKFPFRYRRFRKRLSNAINSLRPDITISTLRRELTFITDLKDGSIKMGEFHVSRYAYGAEAVQSKNFWIGLIKERWSKRFVRGLSRLSKVVILTHEGAKDWPELNNITVIPNPIATPLEGKQTDISSKHAIAVGRYAPQKGFDRLIAAWAIVAQKHPDWTLDIYGEGELQTVLQQQIDELGLHENCILHHTVSNIADKYCMSSIFVLSSRYEGLPLVLGEAMAYGVAPVAFTCPCGPRDMITDGVNGLLVEDGNIEQLANRIGYLIEHEDIRKQLGEKAHQRAKDFTMEAISLQWKALFEELMSTK